MGGGAQQTLVRANAPKKGQRHHVQVESSPRGLSSVKRKKNKNKDSDLCIQLFVLASNIIGQ